MNARARNAFVNGRASCLVKAHRDAVTATMGKETYAENTSQFMPILFESSRSTIFKKCPITSTDTHILRMSQTIDGFRILYAYINNIHYVQILKQCGLNAIHVGLFGEA